MYRTFDKILPALKSGRLFKRGKGWGGDELFIKVIQTPIIEGEQSTPMMVIKTKAEGFSPYAPGVCDVLAYDWVEVNEDGEPIEE